MRMVNYEVAAIGGNVLHTTSYSEATSGGNRILKTYFTEVDERTPAQIKKEAERREVFRAKLAEQMGW